MVPGMDNISSWNSFDISTSVHLSLIQKVQRINFLIGVIRLIQNRKNEKGKEQNF